MSMNTLKFHVLHLGLVAMLIGLVDQPKFHLLGYLGLPPMLPTKEMIGVSLLSLSKTLTAPVIGVYEVTPDRETMTTQETNAHASQQTPLPPSQQEKNC